MTAKAIKSVRIKEGIRCGKVIKFTSKQLVPSPKKETHTRQAQQNEAQKSAKKSLPFKRLSEIILRSLSNFFIYYPPIIPQFSIFGKEATKAQKAHKTAQTQLLSNP